MFKRLFLALATTVMLTQGVALYGLAGASELAYLFGIGFLVFMFLPNRNVVSVVASFFGATLLVWAMISMFGLYDKNCYRPEQLLIAYDMQLDSKKHRADAELTMTQPFGDLGAMTTDAAVPRTSREVTFRTDGAGYRNNANRVPGDVLLVGDSFIQGSGNTQADTLSSVLLKDQGVASYSVGAPGDLFDYAVRAQAFGAEHDGKIFLFLFEGNDFDRYKGKVRPVLERYVRLMRSTDIGKFFRLQMARLKGAGEAANVEVLPMENRRVAFYAPYIEETRRTECKAGELFLPLLKSLHGVVDGVFFIPTKYRVYAPQLLVDNPETLPNANWDFLADACRQADIPCYNLTEPMRAEARILWDERSELLWWPDDTHWNRNGVAVAARAVADVLRGAPMDDAASAASSESGAADDGQPAADVPAN